MRKRRKVVGPAATRARARRRDPLVSRQAVVWAQAQARVRVRVLARAEEGEEAEEEEPEEEEVDLVGEAEATGPAATLVEGAAGHREQAQGREWTISTQGEHRAHQWRTTVM